jgi:excisionase family DNA binding protein
MRRQPRAQSDGDTPAPAAGVAAAEPWVSVEQVAAHLGVKKISVYRWIETRGLPARKIGKLWKLKLSDVDSWVRARGETGARETPVPSPDRDLVPAASATRRGRAARARSRSSERIVLVIDDDELVRDSIGDFLSDKGYVVLVASDDATALDLLAAPPHPHVIVLDLKMPRLDGWKFRELQLNDPELAAIPVIVVTATSDERLNGASAVLRKPLRLPQLARAVDALLDMPQHRGEFP